MTTVFVGEKRRSQRTCTRERTGTRHVSDGSARDQLPLNRASAHRWRKMGSEWRARTFGAGAGYVRRASTVRAGAGVPQESGESSTGDEPAVEGGAPEQNRPNCASSGAELRQFMRPTSAVGALWAVRGAN